MGRPFINEVGNKYGRLVVLERNMNYSGAGVGCRWICKCSCGNVLSVIGTSLRDGHTKSCGCYKEDYIKSLILPNGEAAFNRLYSKYRVAARDREYSWELSKEQFKQLTKQNCYYCNIEPYCIESNNRANSESYLYNGIDRVDNSKGYSVENCVPCCEECNRGKLTKTESEFKNWIIRVYEHFIKEKEDE